MEEETDDGRISSSTSPGTFKWAQERNLTGAFAKLLSLGLTRPGRNSSGREHRCSAASPYLDLGGQGYPRFRVWTKRESETNRIEAGRSAVDFQQSCPTHLSRSRNRFPVT